MPFGTGVIFAPGDVNPGHIILAPLRTNLIAPLSTCSHGRKNGTANKENVNKFYVILKAFIFEFYIYATALK